MTIVKKWIHPSGLRCVIRENSIGFLCGYVKVPSSKLRERVLRGRRAENAAPFRRMRVHGGVTFFGRVNGPSMDGVFVGFDCAHYGDLPAPGSIGARFNYIGTGVYRDVGYVAREVDSMAEQLSAELKKEK